MTLTDPHPSVKQLWPKGTRVYWRGLGHGKPDRGGTVILDSPPTDHRACIEWDDKSRNGRRNEPVWATRYWLAVIPNNTYKEEA
jgi:hypothetical protein